MTQLLAEEKISLKQVAKLFDVNVATAWRWAQKGVRGVRLETFAAGGRRFTTEQALERFVAESSIAAGLQPPAPSNRKFERDAEAAERELAEMGL